MNPIPVVDVTPVSAPAAKVFAQVNGKFYVRLTKGYYQNLRRLVSWPLLALYFAVVWVQWNGLPLVQFDFSDRRIILFGHWLSWSEMPLLAGLLIAGAALLFFLAVAWGRVWCGFACPQSIWTWLFIRIEHLTEGSAARQKKADERGLTTRHWAARISKHVLWLLLALATAITFTGYFVPVRELTSDLIHLQLASPVWLWVSIMALLTYANAGLVREKICLHACPYSRFQSVMFDADTRTVSYDAPRGEPRGGLSQNKTSCATDSNSTTKGDCVDCTLCVQVCPTGIDIRNGLQAACIDCGACIDACDAVMDKLQRARGLIRFASENQLQKIASPLLRPRLITYATIVFCTASLVFWAAAHRSRLLIEVQRDRGQLFSEMSDGSICNDYRIKVENFVPGLNEVAVSVKGRMNNNAFNLSGPLELNLQQAHASWQNFRVCSAEARAGRSDIEFVFSFGTEKVKKASTFLAPRV